MGDWVEEPNELLTQSRRKRRRPKRTEFVGWGSKQLITFLELIGKSSEEKISQHDLTDIIYDYINEKNLLDPAAKRKKVLCDASLQAIFGKRSILRIKIFDLLEPHYAENELTSDSEGYSSDEREEGKRAKQKLQMDAISEEEANKRKKAAEELKSCPAAIVPENIKGVFLRKTLVQELLKDPDSFESKVLGSFVRVKADRYDYRQKNPYVLQLVTGIKKDAADGDNVRLEIADMCKRVSLSELSDVNFSEDECKDLHRRIKEDLLKQPTVGELQEKVQLLHEDITKEWLPREIKRLGNVIDVANEKGWRREMFEYLEKRKLLKTPAEQSRLLQAVPEVLAEKLQFESVPENTADCPKKQDSVPQTATDWVISNGPAINGGTTTSGAANPKVQEHEPLKAEPETDTQLQPPRIEVEQAGEKQMFQGVENGHLLSFDLSMNNAEAGSSTKKDEEVGLNQSSDQNDMKTEGDSQNDNDMRTEGDFQNDMRTEGDSSALEAELIVLSDDEEERISDDEALRIMREEGVWNYIDPDGELRGPFNLNSFKRWKDDGYFDEFPGFAVWKSGESQRQQVLLSELLRQVFRH